jgi:hypothetical protein
MKQYLAIYIGTASALDKARWSELEPNKREKIETAGMQAWADWGKQNAGAIVAAGGPLGKTKRVSADGIGDTTNTMAGYVIVQAESHEAAARLFERHPHFAIFPGDSVEIMECLPVPGR